MSTDSINFSVVAYLSGEGFEKAREIQKNLFEITGSKKCMEDWSPHVTIGDGIIVSKKDLPELENKLSNFVANQEPVDVSLKDFGGIDSWKGAVANKVTPFVIWVDVEMNPELLGLWNNLKGEIISQYDKWLPETISYNPHVTIAFADLTEEGYMKGMKYLSTRTFNEIMTIGHVALAECYGEGNMTSREYKRFYFK